MPYVVVRIATDDECNDVVMMDRLRRHVAKDLGLCSYRQIYPRLVRLAERSGVALLDEAGDLARLGELSEQDWLAMEYFVRDFALRWRPDVPRRIRNETLERRRALLTIYRMIHPREMTTLDKSDEVLGLTFTEREPLIAQI